MDDVQKLTCEAEGGVGAGVLSVRDNSKLDLDSIVSKLLLSVTPNLIWVTQRNKVFSTSENYCCTMAGD